MGFRRCSDPVAIVSREQCQMLSAKTVLRKIHALVGGRALQAAADQSRALSHENTLAAQCAASWCRMPGSGEHDDNGARAGGAAGQDSLLVDSQMNVGRDRAGLGWH